jgi:hypothetical protein
MNNSLEFVQRLARECARSGKHVGWRSVVFQLQFEPELKQVFWAYTAEGEHALQWLHNPATKAEIDELCFEARISTVKTPETRLHSSKRHGPEAA